MLYVLLGLRLLIAVHAADFDECTRALVADAALRPYLVSTEGVFPKGELEQLARVFDLASAAARPYPSEHVPHINPFFLELEVAPGLIKRKIVDLPASVDVDAVEEMGLRLLERVLRSGAAHDFLGRLSRIPRRRVTIGFFGIRYFVSRGRTLPGLGWHRDVAHWQALVLLRRPRRLSGGETVLGWPHAEEVPMGLLSDDEVPRRFEWRPHLETNHLLLFDGARTVHRVSDFRLPLDQDAPNAVEYRDVVGLTLK